MTGGPLRVTRGLRVGSRRVTRHHAERIRRAARLAFGLVPLHTEEEIAFSLGLALADYARFMTHEPAAPIDTLPERGSYDLRSFVRELCQAAETARECRRDETRATKIERAAAQLDAAVVARCIGDRAREREAYTRRLADAPDDRLQLLERTLERKRSEHPELHRPLTWWSALAIIRREDIVLTQTRTGLLAGKAVAFPSRDGSLSFGILLDNSWRNRGQKTRVLAHELAHVWLHVADEELRDALHEEMGDLLYAPVRARTPLNERIEAEADTFGARLLAGS